MNTPGNNIDNTDAMQALAGRWKELGKNNLPEQEIVKRAARRTTEQQKLVKTFRNLAVVGLLLPALATQLQQIGLSMTFAIIYSVFGIVMAIWYFILQRRINNLNFLNEPVIAAIEKIISLEKTHIMHRRVSIVVGLAIIGLALYEFWVKGEMILFYAGLGGAVVGVAIGLAIQWRIMRSFRKWRKSFDIDTLK